MSRDKNRKSASDDSEEIIARADALLARHRKQQNEQATVQLAATAASASKASDDEDYDPDQEEGRDHLQQPRCDVARSMHLWLRLSKSSAQECSGRCAYLST